VAISLNSARFTLIRNAASQRVTPVRFARDEGFEVFAELSRLKPARAATRSMGGRNFAAVLSKGRSNALPLSRSPGSIAFPAMCISFLA
jgi:hypothetical protein